MSESKTHLIADESLGGVLREYVEVERKADVGDYVYFSDDVDTPEYLKVTGYDHEIDYLEVEHNPEEWGATVSVSWEACRTLEPTDIVQIDDVRYRMVDRKAEVGEKVIVVVANDTLVYRNVGEIVEIIETDGSSFGGMIRPHDFGKKGAIYHFQYLVLEPVEPAEESDDVLTVDETEASKSVIDLLANLARRVADLEQKLGGYARKIDGIEIDIQNINIDLGVVEETAKIGIKIADLHLKIGERKKEK